MSGPNLWPGIHFVQLELFSLAATTGAPQTMSFLLIRFCSVAEKILTALEKRTATRFFFYPSTILSYKLIVAVTFIPFDSFSFRPNETFGQRLLDDVITLNSLFFKSYSFCLFLLCFIFLSLKNSFISGGVGKTTLGTLLW